MFTLSEITNQKLNVQLMARDNDNTVTELSGLKDELGKTVLRVVDAAPFAYNQATDRLRVETVQSESTRSEVLFVGTVGAGLGQDIYVEFNGESEAWVLIETDQPTWTFRSGTFASLDGVFDNTFFPKIGSNQATTHTSTNPAVALFLPMGVIVNSTFTYPTTLEEARRFPVSAGKNEFRLRYSNNSVTLANVVVKLIRVFK